MSMQIKQNIRDGVADAMNMSAARQLATVLKMCRDQCGIDGLPPAIQKAARALFDAWDNMPQEERDEAVYTACRNARSETTRTMFPTWAERTVK